MLKKTKLGAASAAARVATAASAYPSTATRGKASLGSASAAAWQMHSAAFAGISHPACATEDDYVLIQGAKRNHGIRQSSGQTIEPGNRKQRHAHGAREACSKIIQGAQRDLEINYRCDNLKPTSVPASQGRPSWRRQSSRFSNGTVGRTSLEKRRSGCLRLCA